MYIRRVEFSPAWASSAGSDAVYGHRTTHKVTIQTVRAVKKFLDGELAKYETWEDVKAKKVNDFINLFQNRVTRKGKPINPRAAFG